MCLNLFMPDSDSVSNHNNKTMSDLNYMLPVYNHACSAYRRVRKFWCVMVNDLWSLMFAETYSSQCYRQMSVVLKWAAHFRLFTSFARIFHILLAFYTMLCPARHAETYLFETYVSVSWCVKVRSLRHFRLFALLNPRLGIDRLSVLYVCLYPSLRCVEEESSAAPYVSASLESAACIRRSPGACLPASGLRWIRLILARDSPRLVWRHPTK